MTKTEEETERLGSRFAKWFLTRDDVPSTRILCLNGDVGSGKSVFSRGFVREIVGQHVDVPSPTYLLVNEYENANQTRVLHADLYRLSEDSNFDVLGIPFVKQDDTNEGQVICLIEWPERLGQNRDVQSRLDLYFEHDQPYDPFSADSSEQCRSIRVSDSTSTTWRGELLEYIKHNNEN